MIGFRAEKMSGKSRARLGVLETPHGVIETPAFVPVATQGTVKTLTAEQALATGSQLLICNTFHLHLKPGEEVVQAQGGLHEMMKWPRPLMTDSGGYQVFSLGFGMDHNERKVMKAEIENKVKAGAKPKNIKITEDGVYFRSPINGDEIFISPKESIRIQEVLGADIIYAFDECTPPSANYEYTKKSLVKTHRWAKESLEARRGEQAIYGIVQGGKYMDLREESARHIASLGFDGFGIGGEFGADKETMRQMIETVVTHLPEEKPRHLLGIGYPEDIPIAIAAGVDTFDCIVPTHFARHGVAFTAVGKLDLNKTVHLKDASVIEAGCGCATCAAGYSKGYITHLLRAKEILGFTLITMHNLHYFNMLVAGYREKIKNGEL
ncbi:MAG: tRNA guanosine(34) transglycosylase Tgt [Candidatus Harrisonbacteria bacterium]|nr:tRNA guanosine(34) transglycosylase Tgt [Candidatus Harrisonbacteria bacterium]